MYALLKLMVARQNFLVLDTETTGLEGEVCQIAVINWTGRVLIDTLVKPSELIPADASRIHGITNEMVKDAPTWRVVSDELLLLLPRFDVIAYNAIYDRKMMHHSAERALLPRVDWKMLSTWCCAMHAYAEFFGEWNEYHQSYRWKSLSFAASHCDVEVKDEHSALGDCRMTLGIVDFMAGF